MRGLILRNDPKQYKTIKVRPHQLDRLIEVNADGHENIVMKNKNKITIYNKNKDKIYGKVKMERGGGRKRYILCQKSPSVFYIVLLLIKYVCL